MLTEFESFRVAGAPYVEIYRDHADPAKFYLLPDRPRLAVDERTALPLFSFTLFSRDIDIAFASTPAGQPVENQLGAVNFTCDLTVDPAQLTVIREALVGVLQREQAEPSFYNKIFRVDTTSTEPVIGYADTWTQGTVRLDMLEDLGATFKRNSSKEGHPQLRGSMAASLWATFGSEGAQLLWKVLNPDTDEAATPGGQQTAALQANIVYDLVGIARSPALRVTVKVDGGPLYTELRNRTTIHEQSGNSSWTYPEISKLVKELRDTRVIDIHWEDYGIPGADPQADELKKQLETTVLGIISNKIVDLAFKSYQVPGVKDEDLGKTFTHTNGGIPGTRLWLDEYADNTILDFSFTLDYEANYPFKAYPQTSLLTSLTPAQRRQLVRVVDVGSPEVRVLEVPVYTNADFAGDHIANITATLSYREFDTLVNDWVETGDTFVFTKGDEKYVFRTRMARDEQGRLIDHYDARAVINYVGTSTPPPPVELQGVTDRALTFSYDKLGYVNVTVQAGDIDWTQIKDVYCDFGYDAARGEPDSKGTVHLTKDKQEDRWRASKHGAQSNRYTYTPRYVFLDGKEVTGATVSDDREMLVVHDTIVGRIRRSFDVSLDPQTVENVTVVVRYENPPQAPEESRNVFTTTGSWEYVRPVSDHASQNISYSVGVSYKDQLTERRGPFPLAPGDDPPTIVARRYRFSIGVDGEGIDWNRWRSAYVRLHYNDQAHGYDMVSEELKISREAPYQSVDVFAFSPTARAYGYSTTFVPRDGSDPVQVPPDGSEAQRTGVLLLETLV